MTEQVEVGHAGCGHHAMMVGCAVTTCLPSRDEYLRGAVAAPDERPGQGHRDPGPAPPARRAAATTGQRKSEVRPSRSCLPCSAAAPSTAGGVTSAAAAGTPGHDPAMAPPPDRAAARRKVHTETAGPATDGAFHPRSRAAFGPGESQLGIS